MELNLSSSLPAQTITLKSEPGLFDYLQSAFFGVMALVTVVCNSFALVVLHRFRQDFEDVSRVQFRSLAITNMVSGLVIGGSECIYNIRGYISEAACAHLPFVYSFMMLSSTYHVALINLLRYLAVCYPFRYIRIVTVKRLGFIGLGMEVVFFGISIVFFPGPEFPLTNFMKSWCGHRSIDFIENDGASLDKAAFITFAVFGILIVIPFVLLTFMNIRLLFIAKRASRRQHIVFVQTDQESANSDSSTPGLKGLRTVLIITGLFYVSVIPVSMTFSAFASEASLSQRTYDALLFVSSAILVCSCWWNVPVYMSTSSVVHQRALELWQKLKCCNSARHGNRITYCDDLTLHNQSNTGFS